MAMVAVLVLSGVAAVMEMQSQHHRSAAGIPSPPAGESLESAPGAVPVVPSTLRPRVIIVG